VTYIINFLTGYTKSKQGNGLFFINKLNCNHLILNKYGPISKPKVFFYFTGKTKIISNSYGRIVSYVILNGHCIVGKIFCTICFKSKWLFIGKYLFLCLVVLQQIRSLYSKIIPSIGRICWLSFD